jgi:hypothetical protein
MPMRDFDIGARGTTRGKYRESCWITFGKTQPTAARTGLINWCGYRGA